MSELKEKCAVVAYVGEDDQIASYEVYDMLHSLQHRGAEASGIVSTDSNADEFTYWRGNGLVRDVFNEASMERLTGNIALGHNRYSTNGRKTEHIQPVIDDGIGFAFATNGNLPVTDHLKTYLEKNHIRINDLNDSEMSAYAIAQQIRNGHNLPDAIELMAHYFRGSYSSVVGHDGIIVAFRDPYGIRPLEIGENNGRTAVASETCALDIVNAEHVRSVQPGEMVIISRDGLSTSQFAEGSEKLDMFEFVYFARPDSKLYGQSVGSVRVKSGKLLAKEHPDLGDISNNTVVVPVPDTARQAAEGVQDIYGYPICDAIVKNRYIGRSFMQPSEKARDEQLKRKFSFDGERIIGKDLILVDDSIVRLNTAPMLVKQAYSLGARSVSMLIASPPVRFPDFYGIDTPGQSELVAANMTIEEIRRDIGCEYLGFLSLSNLINSTGMEEDKFNLSCFTGEYPIEIGKNKRSIAVPVEMSYVE